MSGSRPDLHISFICNMWSEIESVSQQPFTENVLVSSTVTSWGKKVRLMPFLTSQEEVRFTNIEEHLRVMNIALILRRLLIH